MKLPPEKLYELVRVFYTAPYVELERMQEVINLYEAMKNETLTSIPQSNTDSSSLRPT